MMEGSEVNPDLGDVVFRNDDERVLFEEARLGQEAIAFLHTPLGRWLRAVADQEKQEAMETLLDVDYTNGMQIAHYQMKAKIAECFVRWIGEAIQNGRVAEQQLETMEQEDNP